MVLKCYFQLFISAVPRNTSNLSLSTLYIQFLWLCLQTTKEWLLETTEGWSLTALQSNRLRSKWLLFLQYFTEECALCPSLNFKYFKY